MAGRAGALWLCAAAVLGAAAELRLTLLHTNDVHGRVEARGAGTRSCAGAQEEAAGCFGGAARRAARVAAERAAHRNVLLLDAGDQYQGTVWFSRFKGREAAHFMNLLRYDAMALGNHEFDEGVSGLLDPLLKNANFTILSANIKGKTPLGNEMMKYVHPFKIVHFGSESVGIVGYTTKETSFLSQPGDDVIFEDEIEALQTQVHALTAMGVNKIIALGHSGFTVDKNIAKKVKGADVVIGLTNTFLYTAHACKGVNKMFSFTLVCDLTKTSIIEDFESDTDRNNCILQLYIKQFGVSLERGLGSLRWNHKAFTHLPTCQKPPAVSLVAEGLPKPEVASCLLPAGQMPAGGKESPCTGTLVPIRPLHATHGSIGFSGIFRPLSLCQLACPAHVTHTQRPRRVREFRTEKAKTKITLNVFLWSLYENVRRPDKKSWNRVSMCLLNGGGIRSPIDEQSTNGSITMEDLLSVLPFGGRFDLVRVKGSTLKEAFEHSVHGHGRGSGELLQVAGIHVVYDLSRAPGSRGVSLQVLCTTCRVPAYVPLQVDEIHNVTLPSSMLFGGDGYHTLKDKNLGYSKDLLFWIYRVFQFEIDSHTWD
ncbi:LOW QUALITY PROTEIN: snake venom 5'-nucleotidase-like [Rhynochetos jubatus]